ncbi:Putative lipoate-protein ligase A [Wickerhamiella sorbophila]|uniref:Putative lipoate-protein ligase A n=1 Tax=Wickerhamiella sorbophila TaxID=45607 RepID=A0A2T0FGL0_9ASCO|nr:Putative lipoate-protein ligase A [Wickerhamiella sorbophila]PRT54126.1 Putative lipoate-protein ligase A [Wickerhamiella sorbophila]
MDRIVVSRSLNPYVNLAIETVLFKSSPSARNLLFLYVNKPCVVLGRNQNPWKEINLPAAFRHNVPVIRRRSGGGTVVHDEGNVNFCVQTSRGDFSRTKHIEMIVTALRAKGQSLEINERHDIINASNQKVSGSSYKIERERAYHHATMLLNADLPRIRAVLHRTSDLGTISGLGTDSVPSPIANCGISRQLYMDTWIEAFQQHYTPVEPEFVDEKTVLELSSVQEEIAALKSWHL